MEFDKSKVYTALNADEVKIGSKGYFADTLAGLRMAVLNADTNLRELTDVYNETIDYRFETNDGDNVSVYNLFYLVEELKEKKFRPYKDTDEMIEDFKRRYNSYGGWSGKNNPMYNPLIWIKSKAIGFRHLVTDYGDDENCNHCNRSCIWIGSISIGFKKLLDDYTYLDGSPCGIEEYL